MRWFIIPAALLGILEMAGDAAAQPRGRGPIQGYVNPIIRGSGFYNGRYYDGRYNNDAYYYDGRYYNYPYRTYYYYPPIDQAQYDDDVRLNAWVTVRVPANAEVWIDGAKTDRTGTMRDFISPALDKGGTYHITAKWMQNGQPVERQRDVRVEPGRRTMVDFLAGGEERAPDKVNRAQPKEKLQPDKQSAPKLRDIKVPGQDN